MARALDLTIRLEPGGEVFNRRFTRFVSTLTDFRDAFHQMAQMWGAYEEAVFASQGAVGGAAWAPLKPSTIRQKGNAAILVDHGAMRADLIHPHASIEPRSMVLTFTDPKIRFHQTGTRRMKARPPVRLSERIRDDWMRVVHKHLVTAAQGGGD